MSSTTKLVILGGGNGAHAWAGIASSMVKTTVRVLTLFENEAERWRKALEVDGFCVTLTGQGQATRQLCNKPHLVTNRPEEAVPGSDVIAFVMPAFAHEQYLKALKPYIEPGMILVGMPGQSGFNLQVRGILGKIAQECTIMNFESLPWACRIKEFGASCEVLGTKETLLGAMQTGKVPPKVDPIQTLQHLLGSKPALIVKGHILGATLMSTNAYLHTSILYARWASWNGEPLNESPLFYQGVDQHAAEVLSSVSDEVVSIARAIASKSPDADMSEVVHIYDWYMRCYPNQITDKTNLETSLQTNAAYRGLVHPMKKTQGGKLVPNFEYRYMTEDIPYGLVVIRGIAEVVGVPTPNMDKVITWAQEEMSKEFLVNGRVEGTDIKETRAPQRYGLKTVEDIV